MVKLTHRIICNSTNILHERDFSTMKTSIKKIAVIFAVVVVMVASLALVASAEKADFTPPAEFSDITPENG